MLHVIIWDKGVLCATQEQFMQGYSFFLFVWNDRIFQQLWQARSANKTRYYPHYSKLKDYAPSAIILNKIKKTFNWMTLLMTPIDTLCIGSNILRLERHWKEWKRVRRWALMVGDIVIVWLTKLTSREVYWYKFTRISEIFKAVPITEECNTMKIREWVIKHRLRGMKRVSMNQFDFFLERAEELHIIILRKKRSKMDQNTKPWRAKKQTLDLITMILTPKPPLQQPIRRNKAKERAARPN